MKFKIEIDHFWLDEDSDLEPSLKKYIINEVVRKIEEKNRSIINNEINRIINKKVDDVIIPKINDIISEIMKQEKIYISYTGYNKDNEEITIEEYIKKKFLKDSGWDNPKESIEILAKQFSKELKDRYDIMFASHIVSKINEVGLLKEGAEKILLENNGKDSNT